MSATLQFLAPTATVNVGTNQSVVVSSQITLGTSTGASDSLLRLWICYQPSGGTITTMHPTDWVTPIGSANSRAVYPINDVVTGLSAGTYQFGMCGQWNVNGTAVPNPWNSGDWAYTTAQVIAGASVSS